MSVIREASVISLGSDTEDEIGTPTLRVSDQKSSQIVHLLDDEDDEDDAPQQGFMKNIDFENRGSGLIRNGSKDGVIGRAPRTFHDQSMARRDIENDYTQTHPDLSELPFQNEFQPLIRSHSLLAREQERMQNDFNPAPVHSPRALRPAQTARGLPAPEQHLNDHTAVFDDYDDDLRLFDQYYRAPSDPATRWQSPIEEDFDMAYPANSIDLTGDSPAPSFDEILVTVLEVLPDVCPDYVRDRYIKYRKHIPRVEAEALLADILTEDKYPKRKASTKRRRDSDEESQMALKDVVADDQILAASKALQKKFPFMRAHYINTVLNLKKSIYETLVTLKKIEKNQHTSQYRAPEPLRKRRRPTGDDITDIHDPNLKAQFEAAQERIVKDEEAEMARKKQIEDDELATKRAFELKDISECQCCFDEYPNAKVVVCDGDAPHHFCVGCLESFIKAQLDLQKHDIRCMDSSGCKAAFSRSSKKKALDSKTFERLERIQQQNELRDSGLPLSKCPFCDYAAICPPIEEDRELRCLGPDCEIISCRLCMQKSHLPLTCAEYKKEQGVDERHQIEEEMTKAFLRQCPKCNIPIIKDGGCNKITCSVCHSHICDVCGKDITKQGYSHFGKACPQSDEISSEQRAAKRVLEAETAARQQVMAENPDLSAEDLKIKLSEAVRNTDKNAARPNNPYLAAIAARRLAEGGLNDRANLAQHNFHGHFLERFNRYQGMFPVTMNAHQPVRGVPTMQAHALPYARPHVAATNATRGHPQPPPVDNWGQTAYGMDYPGFPLPNAAHVAATPPPNTFHQPFMERDQATNGEQLFQPDFYPQLKFGTPAVAGTAMPPLYNNLWHGVTGQQAEAVNLALQQQQAAAFNAMDRQRIATMNSLPQTPLSMEALVQQRGNGLERNRQQMQQARQAAGPAWETNKTQEGVEAHNRIRALHRLQQFEERPQQIREAREIQDTNRIRQRMRNAAETARETREARDVTDLESLRQGRRDGLGFAHTIRTRHHKD